MKRNQLDSLSTIKTIMKSTVSAALLISLVCLSAVDAGLFSWSKESPNSAEAKEAVDWVWSAVSGSIHFDTKVYNYLRLLNIVDAASRSGMYKVVFDVAQTECYMGKKLSKEEQDKCELDKDEVSLHRTSNCMETNSLVIFFSLSLFVDAL